MTRLTYVLLLAACTAEPVDNIDDVEPYAPPKGVTLADHQPLTRLSTFPDALHVVDADTPTGAQLKLLSGVADWLDNLLPESFTLVEALEDLDGFGTSAGVMMSFTKAVDPDSLEAHTRFVAVASGEAVPFELSWTDLGRTAVVTPLFPLLPATEYAVVVTKDLVDELGEPVWRNVALDQAITGTLPGAPASLGTRWDAALETLGLTPDDVAHGTVFPTQSLFTQDEAVAAFLLDQEPSLERVSCTAEAPTLRCEATLTLTDVLGADGYIEAREAPSAQGTYTLPVTLWLPEAGEGPFPVAFHGHGLGGTRSEARGTARVLAPEGWAVLGMDAPRHGTHPLAASGDFFWILEFFGIFASTGGMEIRVLRDDFRLAAWEKLQLLDALTGFDATGDGEPDFVETQMAYTGHSLGGVMGPQLVAMEPRIGNAYLSVPGGRVSEIVHRGETFAPLISLLAPPDATAGDIDRFFPALQAAIERGDPVNWASRVVNGQRDVLVQEVIDDDIIPNSTTEALVRALGVDLVGDELVPIAGANRGSETLPVSANRAGRTVVLHQWDSLYDDGRPDPEPASHTQIFGSDSNELQLRHWFQTWRDDGVSELIDPLAR